MFFRKLKKVSLKEGRGFPLVPIPFFILSLFLSVHLCILVKALDMTWLQLAQMHFLSVIYLCICDLSVHDKKTSLLGLALESKV